MHRRAPLRRSLLRRAALAPRTSVASVTRSTQLLHVQQSRTIHWSNLPDDGERDYWKMAGDYAKFIAPLLLFITIYDYFEDHIPDADPNRLTPSELVNGSFAVVIRNELVVSQLGYELFAYGDFDESGDDVDHDQVMNSASLRDECISHAQIEQDCWGPDRINASYTTSKIKYNIKGSKGRAVVFARVRDDQKNGQYVYLIVTFVETGETLEIIDNREELANSAQAVGPLSGNSPTFEPGVGLIGMVSICIPRSTMHRLAPLRSLTRHALRPPRNAAVRHQRTRAAASRGTNRVSGVRMTRAGVLLSMLTDHSNPTTETMRQAAGAAIIAYLVYEEFFCGPKARMTPKGLVAETQSVLVRNPFVTARLGTPLRSVSARDPSVQFVHLADDEAKAVLRVTYKISGSRSEAWVYVQAHERMDKEEYEYLLVKFDDGHVLEIVDNRPHHLRQQ